MTKLGSVKLLSLTPVNDRAQKLGLKHLSISLFRLATTNAALAKFISRT